MSGGGCNTHWPTLHVRFLRGVQRVGSCWVWQGGKTEGYGSLNVGKNKRGLAHRVAYELYRGPIPAGLTLDHLCRNRACANPYHLEAVTLAENKRRGEGPCARNARMTHCWRGHELTEANVYRKPSAPTQRQCRMCIKIQSARQAAKRAAQA